jgi:hypothetical protein
LRAPDDLTANQQRLLLKTKEYRRNYQPPPTSLGSRRLASVRAPDATRSWAL